MLPMVNLLAATLSTADAIPPEVVMFALPREVLPIAKATVPPGKVVPVTGFTVAVTCVDAFCATVAGLAAARVVVETGGNTTVTITEAVEPLKLALPA